MNPEIKRAFTHIYDVGGWSAQGTNDGQGSTLLFAADMIAQLPGLLRRWDITTLLDASCGEFTWMREVDLGETRYIGADVVTAKLDLLRRDFPQHTWLELDITEDPLPAADMWMCRDTLIHFPRSHVIKALRNFIRSGIPYLLVGHQGVINGDIANFGEISLINWHQPPWNMPEPVDSIDDFNRKMLLFSREQVCGCELLAAS